MSFFFPYNEDNYLDAMNRELNRIAEENNVSFEVANLNTISESFCFVDKDTDRKYIVLNNISNCTPGAIIWRKAHELAHVLLNVYNVKDNYAATKDETEILINIRALSLIKILWCVEVHYNRFYIKYLVEKLGLPRIVYEMIIYLRKPWLKLWKGPTKRLKKYMQMNDRI